MKLNKDYVARKIGGDLILVPTGKAISEFNGLISMQGIGEFVIECLEKEMTRDEILKEILKEFEVSEEVASADLDAFIEKAAQQGLLIL